MVCWVRSGFDVRILWERASLWTTAYKIHTHTPMSMERINTFWKRNTNFIVVPRLKHAACCLLPAALNVVFIWKMMVFIWSSCCIFARTKSQTGGFRIRFRLQFTVLNEHERKSTTQQNDCGIVAVYAFKFLRSVLREVRSD